MSLNYTNTIKLSLFFSLNLYVGRTPSRFMGVSQRGGKDTVRFTRISDETGKQELIDTLYGSLDSQGI